MSAASPSSTPLNGYHKPVYPKKKPRLFGEAQRLTSLMCDEYLIRIGLSPTEIRQRASSSEGLNHNLLAEIQLAHLLAVPFDTSPLHLQDEDIACGLKERPLKLGQGRGVSVDLMTSFHTIVQQRRGGYCFVCNSLFAALLRHLGWRVSELAARVNGNRHADSRNEGFDWAACSHMTLLVDVDVGGESRRYLCDVGFGAGQSILPILLEHGARVPSLVQGESFELRNEALPGADPETFRDNVSGWTLYRHYSDTPKRPGFESAIYHIVPTSLAPVDWGTLNYYNSYAPDAPFSRLLIVTDLLPDGSRRVVQATEGQLKFTLRDSSGIVVEEDVSDPSVWACVDLLKRKLNYGSRPRTMARINTAVGHAYDIRSKAMSRIQSA